MNLRKGVLRPAAWFAAFLGPGIVDLVEVITKNCSRSLLHAVTKLSLKSLGVWRELSFQPFTDSVLNHSEYRRKKGLNFLPSHIVSFHPAKPL